MEVLGGACEATKSSFSNSAAALLFLDDRRQNRGLRKAMIPANRLEELKKLFAEDGIALTNAEALEIGLWLVSRVRAVLTIVPLDKRAQFDTIKGETKAIRLATHFTDLSEWRRASCKKQKPPHAIDVSP